MKVKWTETDEGWMWVSPATGNSGMALEREVGLIQWIVELEERLDGLEADFERVRP